MPRAREWFDFSIQEKGKFYPVNIKITDTTHADNLNCKLGIYFALTGLIPDMPNEINWNTFIKRLYDNIMLEGEVEQDYYFLIINKKNNVDIFCNSLKGLEKLTPNGNNLPFQCKWDTNRKHTKRSFKEAENFLLQALADSIKLRSRLYFDFKKYFPEYV